MSTGNWLRTHRKQVAMHSLVIAGFLVFTLFAAAPLFDRLERIPGESQLHRIRLPDETNGIRQNIEHISSDGGITVEVTGWAFIEGEAADNTEIHIVLASDQRTYVFDTAIAVRRDVTKHFVELGLNLDHSGFIAIVPARKLAAGEYVVGIYIRKGDIEALQYTDSRVEI